MRDIDRIDSRDFLRINYYLHRAFHEISDCKIREPTIDEDTHILACIVRYIDEEFGMSEWCDDHIWYEKKSPTIIEDFGFGFILPGVVLP